MLDPQSAVKSWCIRELNRKFSITVIAITHHMDEAVQAQRVVVITQGQRADGRHSLQNLRTQLDKLCARLPVSYRRPSKSCTASINPGRRKSCRSTHFRSGNVPDILEQEYLN